MAKDSAVPASIACDYFNTHNTILAYCEEDVLKRAVEHCVFFEKLLSKTISGSDIWRINHAEGECTAIDPHTRHILDTALKVSEASQGAFNIAVGAAAKLWHFTDGSRQLPDPEALERAVASIDYRQIRLSDAGVTIPTGMHLDLGGIAKGYITDRVADFLQENGVMSALLNFGGNVVSIGHKPNGKPWSIGLQKPFAPTGEAYFAAVPCVDGTIVTSAVYERGFDLDGKRYHHILDPRTGYPVQNKVVAVTLFGKDSLLADAVSTACFVLGPEKGFPLARQFGMDALYIDTEGHISFPQHLPITFIKQ